MTEGEKPTQPRPATTRFRRDPAERLSQLPEHQRLNGCRFSKQGDELFVPFALRFGCWLIAGDDEPHLVPPPHPHRVGR